MIFHRSHHTSTAHTDSQRRPARRRRWPYIATAVLLLTLQVFTSSALAMDAEQNSLYDNNILYFSYKDDANNCGADANGDGNGPAACAGLQGSDKTEQAYNFFIGKGLSPLISSAIVGNLLLESNLDPTATNSSSGAHGIAQWLGSRLTNEQTYASQNGQEPDSFCLQLDFLWYEITQGTEKGSGVIDAMKTQEQGGGDPQAVLQSLVLTWEDKFERSGGAALAERYANAQQVYSQYGGGGPITGGTPTASAAGGACGNTNGVVAGNIIQTAIGLAWPEPFNKANPPEAGRTSPLTPTPAYVNAMAQYNPGQRADGADCGVFVSTVLRSSGVDPNYPGISTDAQYAYLTSHPEKYQPIDIASIQPGDILIITANQRGSDFGHTYIYLGSQAPGGYNAASASLGDHSGNIGNESSAGFSAFRVIQ